MPCDASSKQQSIESICDPHMFTGQHPTCREFFRRDLKGGFSGTGALFNMLSPGALRYKVRVAETGSESSIMREEFDLYAIIKWIEKSLD